MVDSSSSSEGELWNTRSSIGEGAGRPTSSKTSGLHARISKPAFGALVVARKLRRSSTESAASAVSAADSNSNPDVLVGVANSRKRTSTESSFKSRASRAVEQLQERLEGEEEALDKVDLQNQELKWENMKLALEVQSYKGKSNKLQGDLEELQNQYQALQLLRRNSSTSITLRSRAPEGEAGEAPEEVGEKVRDLAARMTAGLAKTRLLKAEAAIQEDLTARYEEKLSEAKSQQDAAASELAAAMEDLASRERKAQRLKDMNDRLSIRLRETEVKVKGLQQKHVAEQQVTMDGMGDSLFKELVDDFGYQKDPEADTEVYKILSSSLTEDDTDGAPPDRSVSPTARADPHAEALARAAAAEAQQRLERAEARVQMLETAHATAREDLNIAVAGAYDDKHRWESERSDLEAELARASSRACELAEQVEAERARWDAERADLQAACKAADGGGERPQAAEAAERRTAELAEENACAEMAELKAQLEALRAAEGGRGAQEAAQQALNDELKQRNADLQQTAGHLRRQCEVVGAAWAAMKQGVLPVLAEGPRRGLGGRLARGRRADSGLLRLVGQDRASALEFAAEAQKCAAKLQAAQRFVSCEEESV